MSKKNRQWRLANRPEAMIDEHTFQWVETVVAEPAAGEILIRTLYLSLDPANRGWIREKASYVEPVQIGDVMRGLTLGVVEASNNPKFKVGDLVSGAAGWQDYLICDGKGFTVIQKSSLPLTAFLGLLGMVGITAYFGMIEIGQPKAGETVVVSGAAGAVGSIAGQIAKIKGCRVIGIAGSEEKCRWITQELGFDAAINYKTEEVSDRLKELCPEGVDVYFDNVGGPILDAVLGRINIAARIPICGLISQYNASEPVPGPYNFVNVLVKRARIEGFIVLDYMKRAGEAIAALAGWMASGKLKYRIEVIQGLEKAPTALNMLFDGSNQGKLIIAVSPEP